MIAKFEIKKFNKSNFSLWKLKMRAITSKNNYLKVIWKRLAEIIDG